MVKSDDFSEKTSIKGPEDKVPSGPHPAKSSPGRLFCNDPVSPVLTVQPQSQAMGAARRDPRRGEIPGAQRQLRSSTAAQAWGSSVEYRQ